MHNTVPAARSTGLAMRDAPHGPVAVELGRLSSVLRVVALACVNHDLETREVLRLDNFSWHLCRNLISNEARP